MISVEVLDDFECFDTVLQGKVDKLYEAIINWENPVLSVEDYIREITDFLGGSIEINKLQVENVLKNRNTVYNSWKMESIYVLLDLYENEMHNLNLKSLLDKLIVQIQNFDGADTST
jgi:hypothetical protein